MATARAGAEGSALQRLTEAWERAENELAHRRAVVEERLLHLAWGGDPRSSAVLQARATGRRRQRQQQPSHREMRDRLYRQFGVKDFSA